MRYTGTYKPGSIPDLATWVSNSTAARQALVKPLLRKIQVAAVNFRLNEPEVNALIPVSWTKTEREALIDAYEGRTVAVKRSLATMRETLPAAHKDLCPYCSIDTNPDLDHFLPKSVFPEFAILARNLIPICTPCNRKKLNRHSDGSGRREFLFALHDVWLEMELVRAQLSFLGALHVTYNLVAPSPLDGVKAALVERHFVNLALEERFQKRAHACLSAIKESLAARPKSVVRRTLRGYANGAIAKGPLNGWEYALGHAVLASLDELTAWVP